MIKRHYFASAKLVFDDNGSYLAAYVEFDIRSWLPDPVRALDFAIDHFEMKASEKNGFIEIRSFNRV